ncbi:hypothetical protein BRD00_07530 [Halobacteriales archaeon QS_8_69_26]|nr:MAG: hypothetical protein BRD00_07530 [Halobacteriales archaeon QS_8_69_26]
MSGGITRRHLLAAALGGGVAGLATSRTASGADRDVAASTAIGGWPTFGHDPANTGHAAGEPAPVGSVTEEWRFDTGHRVTSSPAVVDGTVYVGNFAGTVSAIDAADGTECWSFEAGTNVESSPAVVDGTVYVGSADERVYAIDAADGTERWSFGTGGAVYSSPTVVDGTVYVGSDDDHVYAIDAAEGTERWSFETGSWVDSSPAVLDGTVYVGSDDDHVYAIDADGSERWSFETGGEVASSPAVAEVPAAEGTDRVVFVGSRDETVYALDAADGTELWRTGISDPVTHSPAVVGGSTDSSGATVFVGGRLSGDLHAIDAATGDVRWRFDTDRHTSPAVAAGTVYVGSIDSNVYAIDAADGTERWSFGTGDNVESAVAVADGRVYVGSYDGHVYAVTGETATETQATTATTSAGDDATTGTATTDATTGSTSTGGGTPSAPDGGTTPAGGSGDPTGTTVESGDDLPVVPLAVGGVATLAALTAGVAWGRRGGDGDGSPGDDERDGVGSPGAPDARPGDGPSDGGSPPPAGREADDGPAGGSDGKPEADPGDGAAGDGSSRTPDEDPVDGSAHGGSSRTPDEDPVDGSAHGGSPDGSVVGGVGRPSGEPSSVPLAPDLSLTYDDIQRGEVIGRGGNADVYQATVDIGVGEAVIAVKEPRFRNTLDADTVESFLEEAETWASLDDHEAIVGVVDWGSRPLPWIAMEYMDAGDLGDRAGTLGIDQALWTALTITRAVRHAHTRGVAHLDLKPENVLFRSTGETWPVPKVADWGLAEFMLARSTGVEGFSPAYAAPEQVEEDRGLPDQSTDIYQLGAVFYELFTGVPPFEGGSASVMEAVVAEEPDPPTAVDTGLPPELDDVLLTALAKEKADRYEDVIYLRDRLSDLYDSH